MNTSEVWFPKHLSLYVPEKTIGERKEEEEGTGKGAYRNFSPGIPGFWRSLTAPNFTAQRCNAPSEKVLPPQDKI